MFVLRIYYPLFDPDTNQLKVLWGFWLVSEDLAWEVGFRLCVEGPFPYRGMLYNVHAVYEV